LLEESIMSRVLHPPDWAPSIGYANGIAVALAAQFEQVWREHMGEPHPAMTMIFVAELLDSPGKIELEATAVLP